MWLLCVFYCFIFVCLLPFVQTPLEVNMIPVTIYPSCTVLYHWDGYHIYILFYNLHVHKFKCENLLQCSYTLYHMPSIFIKYLPCACSVHYSCKLQVLGMVVWVFGWRSRKVGIGLFTDEDFYRGNISF